MTGKLKEAAKVEAVRSSSKRTPDVIGNQPVQTDGAHVRRPLAPPIPSVPFKIVRLPRSSYQDHL